jgi:hypothetical protein
MRKLGIAIVTVCAVLGGTLVPTAPANAQSAGGAVAGCEVTFATWPSSGSASCGVGSNAAPNNWPTDGVAVGVFLPGGPVCLPLCTFNAELSYSTACLAPNGPVSLPSELASGTGTLTVSNGASRSFLFQWELLGSEFVLTFTGGTTGGGEGVFVPMTPLPTCAAPGALTAHIVRLVLAPQ